MIACQHISGRTKAGRANHFASRTGWKSTSPKQIEAMYPTMIPAKIGIRRRSPLAKSDTATVVRSAMMARSQLLFAISTPVPASESPISMITGPTTTGGKSRVMKPTPRRRMSRLMTPYTRPTPDTEQCSRQAKEFCGLDDWGDEGKAAAQEDRNLAFGHSMEDESADSGCHESDRRIKTYKKRDEHSGTECYKQKLCSHDGLLDRT